MERLTNRKTRLAKGGLEPSMIDVVHRLAEYEDLEEDGKLLKLPCAVGDTVYGIRKYIYCPAGTCKKEMSCWECRERAPYKIYKKKFAIDCIDKIGKTIFLTLAEAEAVLKEQCGDLN